MIIMFGGNFAPRGWALCNGQILSIAQNTALFSLLGTTFGGNGQTTFALPDLRGRTPVHTGQGPGLSSYSLGQVGGTESVTLLTNNLPAHTHSLNVNDAAANGNTASSNYLATSNGSFAGDPITVNTFSNAAPNAAMGAQAIGATGNSVPINNIQPYLAVNYIIALEGIYPSRN